MRYYFAMSMASMLLASCSNLVPIVSEPDQFMEGNPSGVLLVEDRSVTGFIRDPSGAIYPIAIATRPISEASHFYAGATALPGNALYRAYPDFILIDAAQAPYTNQITTTDGMQRLDGNGSDVELVLGVGVVFSF